MAGKKKKRGIKFYAVRVGRKTGITKDWGECDGWTHKYGRNQYKSFVSVEEAQYFLKWGDVLYPDRWYAVIKGRNPGVYTSWPQAQLQAMAWRGQGRGLYKRFDALEQAKEEVAALKAIDTSRVPIFRCHFGRFIADTFKPDRKRPFSEEFNKLANHQGWTEGSEEYDRHKIMAILEEFDLQVLGMVPGFKVEEDASDKTLDVDELNRRSMEHRIDNYRYLCMGLKQSEPDPALKEGTEEEKEKYIDDAENILKGRPWINIIDLIDWRRTEKEPQRWHDFVDYKKYTVEHKKTINMDLLQEYQPHEYLRAVLVDLDDMEEKDSEDNAEDKDSFFKTIDVQTRLEDSMSPTISHGSKRKVVASTQQLAKKTKITGSVF